MEENSREDGVGQPCFPPRSSPPSRKPWSRSPAGSGQGAPNPYPRARDGEAGPPPSQGVLVQSGCPWSPYPLSGSHQSLLEGRHMLGQVGGAPPNASLPKASALREGSEKDSGTSRLPLAGPARGRGRGPTAMHLGGGGVGAAADPKSWDRVLRPHLGASQGPEPPRAYRQGAPTLTPKPTKVRAIRQAAWPRAGGPPSRPLLSPGPLWSQQPPLPRPAPGLGLQPERGALVRGLLQPGPAWASLAAAACPADTPSPHIWVGPPREESGPRPGVRLAPMDPCSRAMVGSGQGLLPPQFFALSGPKVSKPYTEKIRTETKPKHRKPTKQPQSG